MNCLDRSSQIKHIIIRLILIFSLCCFPFWTEARSLTEKEVRQAVQTWVRQVTAEARPEAVIERMEPYLVEGETVAYIAHLQGGGFCLCGADNSVLPVYLYSPSGKYSPENQSYQYILWEISERTKILYSDPGNKFSPLQSFEQSLAERDSFWQKLISGNISNSINIKESLGAEPDLMQLPLTSQWNQTTPYNDQCPILTPGSNKHTVTGCGATAQAQVMYYWKWPLTGTGVSKIVNYNWRWRSDWDEETLTLNPGITPNWEGGVRLEWTSTNGGKLRMNGYWDGSLYWAARAITQDASFVTALDNLYNRLTTGITQLQANFGSTTYNWNILTDTPHLDPPGPGDVEVAKLSLHAGISAEMDYGLKSSGTPLYFIDDALTNYFRYDPDVLSAYSDRDINKMTEDIQWARPLMLGGCSSPNNCHIWVAYGYNKGTDPNRQFLMQKGWGSAGEWYSCDSFFPLYQKNLTYIAPLNIVKFVGAAGSGDGSPSNPYLNIEEALNNAADGSTLIFKAGSLNLFSTGSLVINRPLTLKGYSATLQKQ